MLRVNKLIRDIHASQEVAKSCRDNLTFMADPCQHRQMIGVETRNGSCVERPRLRMGDAELDIDHIPALISWLQSLIEEVPE